MEGKDNDELARNAECWCEARGGSIQLKMSVSDFLVQICVNPYRNTQLEPYSFLRGWRGGSSHVEKQRKNCKSLNACRGTNRRETKWEICGTKQCRISPMCLRARSLFPWIANVVQENQWVSMVPFIIVGVAWLQRIGGSAWWLDWDIALASRFRKGASGAEETYWKKCRPSVRCVAHCPLPMVCIAG